MSDTPVVAELKKELPAEVIEAKQKYGRVFKTTFNGGQDTFYIRSISRIEYKQLTANLATVEDNQKRLELHDEHVAQTATVFPKLSPEFLSTSGAGFVTLLANEALRLSGFTNDVQTKEV